MTSQLDHAAIERKLGFNPRATQRAALSYEGKLALLVEEVGGIVTFTYGAGFGPTDFFKIFAAAVAAQAQDLPEPVVLELEDLSLGCGVVLARDPMARIWKCNLTFSGEGGPRTVAGNNTTNLLDAIKTARQKILHGRE